jgi:hypothetical protein
MRDQGYHIIPITNAEQLEYACNVLNLGEGRIVGVHAKSARQIVKSPFFSGDVQVSVFRCFSSLWMWRDTSLLRLVGYNYNLTSLYGGIPGY